VSDQPGQPPVPPYPPQPGAVPSGIAPQPVKKKSRAWIWITVVVVLLLCCAGSAVAGLIGFGMKSASDQSATIKAADDGYTKAVKELQTVAESAATVESPEASAPATTLLDAAGADLSTARDAVRGLPESEGRTVYVQALDEADKAVETLRSIAAESSGKSRFLVTAKEGVRLYDEGRGHMNTAVDLANKNLYGRSGVEAGKAKSFFRQARAKLVEADALDKASDLEKSIAYVDLQLEKVDYALQMADHGNQGKISAYNKVVPKFNAVNTKIGLLKQPDTLSDPNWATRLLEELQTRFTDELTKSGTLIDRAHRLLSGAAS
jgi:ABC-type Na+ efflux pump permease subunit